MHKLIIEDDEGRTTVVPLVRDELTIGRKEGNTIRLTERNVSRRHARLYRQSDEVWVEDFGSYTGVRVNGVRIVTPTALKDSDQVLIGDYKLWVRSEGAAEAILPTVPGIPSTLSAPDGDAGNASAGLPAQAQSPAGPAGAPRHLDAAPTIPLRTLEEQGRAPKLAAATQSARLVVVTTDLAGLEFPVDRPSLVIGRTEENDIILNHASISRHHAKMVRDGDRYTVVDLQSANGVRVAGESYERVDVQPGDVIELGHVKLRFVGALEDWSFQPGDFLPKSRRNLKIGAAVGGVVLAGVLILALQGKKQLAAIPTVVTATPQAPAGPSPATLFADAKAAFSSENWDKAVSALDLLLSRPAANAEAASVATQAVELKRKVDLERRGAEIFVLFQKAAADKEPDVAMSRFDDIPSESVYKGRAEPALEGIKPLFLAAHLDLADAARTQGRCDDAAAEVEKVQQVDPENKKARDILKRCKPRPPARVAAAAPEAELPAAPPRATPPGLAPAAAGTVARPAPARPVAAAPRPPRPPSGRNVVAASESTSGEDGQSDAAAELIKQARDAWMHQQCGAATDLSRRALKLRGNPNEAHQIIAVCACSTKDKEGAIKSYTKLDERSRAMVRTLCARNGVELVE